MLRKAVTDGLTDPITAARLIEAGIDNVKVDGGFHMKDLASQLRDLDDGKVAFVTLSGDPANIDGDEVLRINPTKAAEAIAALGAFAAPSAKPCGRHINGTSSRLPGMPSWLIVGARVRWRSENGSSPVCFAVASSLSARPRSPVAAGASVRTDPRRASSATGSSRCRSWRTWFPIFGPPDRSQLHEVGASAPEVITTTTCSLS